MHVTSEFFQLVIKNPVPSDLKMADDRVSRKAARMSYEGAIDIRLDRGLKLPAKALNKSFAN